MPGNRLSTSEYRRESAREMRQRYGVVQYRAAKRCKRCGCLAYWRTPASQCFECSVEISKLRKVRVGE